MPINSSRTRPPESVPQILALQDLRQVLVQIGLAGTIGEVLFNPFAQRAPFEDFLEETDPMSEHTVPPGPVHVPIPPDDPRRALTVADPDNPRVRHVWVVGDTYTILVSGKQTDGRYCLIDMLVPDGGGPPPHRHDYEEMFSLLDGELEFTFRGETRTVKAPVTVNIPANAPHAFKNVSGRTVHMLCMCAPAGLDEFFLAIGVPIESRSASPPDLSPEERAEKGKLAERLAPRYHPEVLKRA
jgi:quercetin dioxygenase-like cupin family protein